MKEIDFESLTPEDIQTLREELQKDMKAFERKELDLQSEKKLFDQKLQILKISYAQLASEKYALDRDRLKFESEKKHYTGYSDAFSSREQTMAVSLFFKGVSNIMALKKRYKDLIKIFHPDNLCGDKETLQLINREYESLLSSFEARMKDA